MKIHENSREKECQKEKQQQIQNTKLWCRFHRAEAHATLKHINSIHIIYKYTPSNTSLYNEIERQIIQMLERLPLLHLKLEAIRKQCQQKETNQNTEKSLQKQRANDRYTMWQLCCVQARQTQTVSTFVVKRISMDLSAHNNIRNTHTIIRYVSDHLTPSTLRVLARIHSRYLYTIQLVAFTHRTQQEFTYALR